jgi:hypothetical protein
MHVRGWSSLYGLMLAGIVLVLVSGCRPYVSGVYAVRVYEEQGNKNEVAEYLSDSDPNAREEAVTALARMGDCSPRLYAMHRDLQMEVRAALAKGLKYCNTAGAMAALQQMLKDSDSLVRKEAAGPAINNNFCRDECMFGLRKLMEDPDPFVQLYAAKALQKRFPGESRLLVIDHLTSKNYMVRKESIDILSSFKNPEDVYYLGDFLQDNDMTMRVLARKSIEKILGHPASGEELSTIIAKERLPQRVQTAKGARSSSEGLQGDAGTIKDMPRLADFGLSKTGVVDNDAIAVIIGNKEYKSVDVPDVAYAVRDAQIMKKVAQDVLGVPENNIIYIENARSSDFNKIFGTANNAKGMLANWARPNSKIFIYYSGHGSPDANTKEAYFVPVDSDINYIALSGYAVKQLYQNMGALNVKSVTIVLDACFSGLSQAGTITKSASPVFVQIANPFADAQADITVISSSRSDEISTWDDANRFGLFTYAFVKSLTEADTNHDGNITIKEIETYLSQKVPPAARRLMNRDQHPQVFGKRNTIFVEVKN